MGDSNFRLLFLRLFPLPIPSFLSRPSCPFPSLLVSPAKSSYGSVRSFGGLESCAQHYMMANQKMLCRSVSVKENEVYTVSHKNVLLYFGLYLPCFLMNFCNSCTNGNRNEYSTMYLVVLNRMLHKFITHKFITRSTVKHSSNQRRIYLCFVVFRRYNEFVFNVMGSQNHFHCFVITTTTTNLCVRLFDNLYSP